MSRWSAKGIAEALGVIGVIGSLIFVGLEVRQNSAATRAASNGTVANVFVDLNLVIASSPELAIAMVNVGADPAAASEADRILVLGLWRAIFNSWSNIHRQWVNGTLDRVLYQSMIGEVSSYSLHSNTDADIDQIDRRSRTMLWAWGSEQFQFNREFRDFVDSIIATGVPLD